MEKVLRNDRNADAPFTEMWQISTKCLLSRKKFTLLQCIYLLKARSTRLPQGLRGQPEAWPLTLNDTCSVQSEQASLNDTALLLDSVHEVGGMIFRRYLKVF